MDQLSVQHNVLSGIQIMDQNKNSDLLEQSQSQDDEIQHESSLQINDSLMSRKNRKICAVCGDKANGNYYGAVSCEGCKIFFRRSILNETYRSYVCKGSQNKCDVEENRNHCKSCRFNRCKRVGMLDTSVSQIPRSRNRNAILRAELFSPPQQSTQFQKPYMLSNFETIGPNYYRNLNESTNMSENMTPSTSTDTAPKLTDDLNEKIMKITEIYRQTLGREPVVIDSQQMLILAIDPKDKVSEKYKPYYVEVVDFSRKLDILSSLPKREMDANLKNWLDVLLLRSCWWFAQKRPEDEEQVIRVSGRYGLHKDHNELLAPIFSFAETVKEMKMTESELSLATTYILLCGHYSFNPDSTDENDKTLTSQRQEEVLHLLNKYQKSIYPEESMRYMTLLINLTELAYIAGTS